MPSEFSYFLSRSTLIIHKIPPAIPNGIAIRKMVSPLFSPCATRGHEIKNNIPEIANNRNPTALGFLV